MSIQLRPPDSENDPFMNKVSNDVVRTTSYYMVNFIHPFSMLTPPLCLAGMLAYLVIKAFSQSTAYGIRSVSGVLLPLVIITFLFGYRKELWIHLGHGSILGRFIIFTILGFFTLFIINIGGTYGLTSLVPLTEVILSGSFGVLIYGHLMDKHKILPAYYGTISGFLLYIVIFGIPSGTPFS